MKSDQVGELAEPLRVLGPYKSIIGELVRDFIPLKYRKWSMKEDNEWSVAEPPEITHLRRRSSFTR